MNGSPVKPTGHEHTGLWFIAKHNACDPHEPRQAFIHLFLIHVMSPGQSLLVAHSGRQFGGTPMYSGRHLHAGWPSKFLHSELEPHGEGLHGSPRGISHSTI